MLSNRPSHPLAKTLYYAINKVTKPIFKSHGLYEPRILTDWDKIVGPMLAKHSRPLSIRFPKGKEGLGTLIIAVNHSGFATELSHLKPYLLEKIAAYFGYKALGDIKVIVRPKLANKTTNQANTKTAQSETIPVPETIQELTSAHIEDEALRTSLENLGKHIHHVDGS